MVRRLALLGLLASATGCSTTATITRVNDFPIEAELTGGSRETVFIVAEDGREYEVPRKTITDVDHPGNIHAIVGGGFLGYGIVNIAVGVSECDSEGPAFCAGVFTPALVGALLTVWGLVVYNESQSAFDDMSRPSRLPKARPLAAPVARRPRPDTRPVAPVPVQLEEEGGPAATEQGPTPAQPATDQALPPAPTAPPTPSATAPVPPPPPPPAPKAPAPPPAPVAPPATGSAPTKAFPVD